VCSLSGTTVSATGPGICHVYALIAADANYQAATSPDITVFFTRVSQRITVSASPTATSFTNTSTVSSSGSTGTGLITYVLDDGTYRHASSPVCSLSGTTVSATGPGICQVYAKIAADANYRAASSFDVIVKFR
jgi:hypothetical protein